MAQEIIRYQLGQAIHVFTNHPDSQQQAGG
jgi:hypothetical protein